MATDDVSSFFANLKREFGIDFDNDSMADLDQEEATARARHLAEEAAAPTPTPEVGEIAEETYPGSKQKLKTAKDKPPPPPEVDTSGWDATPREYRVKGKLTEFFTIGALAKALGRQVVTLRKWEQRGYLPPSQFRAPGLKEATDRLYTREQVEGLMAILKEEGLTDPTRKYRIDQSNFPEKAHALFARLREGGS